GGETYHNNRFLVAFSRSHTACLLKGLAVATSTDLLMRSKGRRHQRWQTSRGKFRASSMSMSYLSNGKNPSRERSHSTFSDLSSGTSPFSARIWMNGSTTVRGASCKSGVCQSVLKSPGEISLPSTNIFCIATLPSSTSV